MLEPTITAQWQALVKEAEENSHLLLGDELESYLVFLLVRFTNKPEMARSVLALDFLQSVQAQGMQQKNKLRDVGDKCLLFAGLFPGRAQRRRINISYYVDMGQSAYGILSAISQQTLANLYQKLEKSFVQLMDILHTLREFSQHLTLLQAEELWHDTNSQHALATFRRYTQGMPIRVFAKGKH